MKTPYLFTTNVVVSLFLLATSNSLSASPCTSPVATLHSVQGKVEYQRLNQSLWQIAKIGDFFCNGDSVQLAKNSRAALYLKNETVLRLDENTQIVLSSIDNESPSWLELLKGVSHFISRTPQPLKIKTTYANAAIEGTEFVIAVDPVETQQTTITVLEGIVRASNDHGNLRLSSGQRAVVRLDEMPVMQIQVDSWDAVRWALHYPVVSDFSSKKIKQIPESWRETYFEFTEYFAKGKYSEALSRLDALPENISSVDVSRAALYLASGQGALAEKHLKVALARNENNAEALSLSAILAVIYQKNDLALTLAKKAVSANPKLSAAWLALSYAQQAGFKLEQARSSVERAVTIAPNSALAWARFAELYLMFEELDEALAAATRAERIAPELARVQSVLGFSHLTHTDITAAKLAFNKAILLDQADPLPRLGLGLAMIRQGELALGRVQLELAASLAPTNSLIRSYLGKAYFEEKRSPLDAVQLAMAKELDQNDPTPWFYDAIRKQAENRPVEALLDLEKSMELNDNRAVYRSRLLLDEDQAARSVGIARVYRDLGFQSLALKEASKSLNRDATSYSAHRFLASTYSTLPRHQIARASELLQSQLWQPLNASPLRPQFGVTDLGIFPDSGPSSAGFNEYNSLFIRNRFTTQVNAVLGGDGILGDEVVVSGIGDNTSFSVGQFHYESDGFRNNNDQKLDIYNVFFQARLSYKTSLQVEMKKFKRDKGDLVLRFNPDNVKRNFREREERELLRLGFRHKFSRQSQMIVSLMMNNVEFSQVDKPVPVITQKSNEKVSANLGELQHVWTTNRIRVISGFGYFESEADKELAVINSISLQSLSTPFDDEKRIHSNAYSYLYGQYSETLDWLLGIGVDRFNSPLIKKTQFNPKLGLTWQATLDTTLRLAAFRMLKRELTTNQTIEPTQVNGFNQFFDDKNGTASTRFGIAMDHKITDKVFIGGELSRRDLDVPYRDVNGETHFADWQENIYRTYLYYTFGFRTTARLEYQYEKLEADASLLRNEVLDLMTQTIPLEIEYAHPAGWSLRGLFKYVTQEGGFIKPLSISSEASSDESDFWLIDASINYRLPKSYGNFSIQVKNLFDKEFNFQEIDPDNPSLYQGRLLLAKLNFSW